MSKNQDFVRYLAHVESNSGRRLFQNKFFDFLASGRPIVFAGEGESADIIREADAGRVVPAEDDEAVAEAVLSLGRLSVAERQAMGERGRRYVMRHYERGTLSRRLLRWIEDDAEGSGGAGDNSSTGQQNGCRSEK